MTLLIKNIRILAGARDYGDSADIFISGDRISAVGDFPNKKADRIIDGGGDYLSPGFIDLENASDHHLTIFDHPEQDDFLKQGVTTIIGGMRGVSLAPLIYGNPDLMEKWGNPSKINVDWHTTADFLSSIDRHPLGVNFGTFAGYSTVRHDIAGDFSRTLTRNETAVIKKTLARAIREGSFGISVELEDFEAAKFPFSELKQVAAICAENGGIFSVDLGKEDLAASLDAIIKIGKETGAKILINGLLEIGASEADLLDALQSIDALQSGMKLRFTGNLSDEALMPIYSLLPRWARKGGIKVMDANIRDDWFVKRIINEFPTINAADFSVAQAPRNDYLVGKTVAELENLYGVRNPSEALIKLMRVTNMRSTLIHKKYLSPELSSIMQKIMVDPRSFIVSDAPGFPDKEPIRGRRMKSARSKGAFAEFLKFIRIEKSIPIEEAVPKLTSEPARFLGLQNRGIIKEGAIADLACFNEDGEIRFTVVSGRVVIEGGEFRNMLPGRALRHKYA